jgi:hypothetical protein
MPQKTLGQNKAFVLGAFDALLNPREGAPDASRRFNTAENIEHKKAKDEWTLLDQEIWCTIRYLDPDVKDKASDSGVIVTLLAVVAMICAVVVLLHSRGL